MSSNTNRLRKFLETKTDVEISAQPAVEDQTLDFSDVEQLLGSINTIPGAHLPRAGVPAPPGSLSLEVETWMARNNTKT